MYQDDAQLTEFINTARRLMLFIVLNGYFIVTAVTNIFALIVLSQRAFYMNAFANGQKYLAVLETVLAILTILPYIIVGSIGFDIELWNMAYCMAYKTTVYIIVANSNWCVVYLTVVRYLSIKNPLTVNTNSFIQAAYVSLMAISVSMAVFYTLVYHEVIRRFGNVKSTPYIGECFSFVGFPINQYLYRTILMLPETILPAILITTFNILLYKEFVLLDIRTNELKQDFYRRSKRISQIKHMIRLTESARTITDLENVLPEKDTPSSKSLISYVVRTALFNPNDQSKKGPRGASKKHVNDLRDDNSDQSSGIDSHRDIIRNRSKEYLLRNLKSEQKRLRRVTIAYAILQDLNNPRHHVDWEDTSKRFSRKSLAAVSQFQQTGKIETVSNSLTSSTDTSRSTDLTKSTKSTKSTKTSSYLPRRMSLSPVTRMLIMSSVLFIVLYGPNCLWYILSSLAETKHALNIAINKMVSAVVHILQCMGHLCMFFLYVFPNNKVRKESKIVVHKFLLFVCSGRR